MSTRSAIAVQINETEWRSIYVHFDGYPYGHSSVGQTLIKYYSHPSRKKVLDLLDLGDVSVLDQLVWKNEYLPHDFVDRQDGVTLFYHRDRGDDWSHTKPLTLHLTNKEDIFEFYGWIEYAYFLGLDGNWTFIDVQFKNTVQPLKAQENQ